MSRQTSKIHCDLNEDPIEEIAIENDFVSALDEADHRKIGPDLGIVNVAVKDLELARKAYDESQTRFKETLLSMGYEVMSIGSYYDEQAYFVHHSAPINWSDWAVRGELESKQLVIRW
jgi:hypothetical protein